MKKVVIIGAGIAGISAAKELLEQEKFEVTIIEAQKKIGGRCYSFIDKENNEFDNGQHIMAGAYSTFFELVKWLQAEEMFYYPKAINVPFVKKNGKTYSFNCEKLYGKLGQLVGLLNLKVLSNIEKFRLLYVLFAKNNYKDNDIPVLQFLQNHKQSINIITHFWEPIILATLNSPINIASTYLFLNVLQKLILGTSEESKLIFPTQPLGHIFTNFENKLYKTPSSSLILQKKVSHISQKQNNFIVQLNDNSKISTDYIISAIAPYQLKSIKTTIPQLNEIKDINENFTYSTIISIYLKFDRNIMAEDFLGAIGTKIHWVFNVQKLQKLSKTTIALTISAAESILNLKQNNLLNIILEELKLLLPKSINAKLIDYRILKNNKATILITNKNNNLRPKNRTSLSNFFIAGDWTATELPATIESAAESGKLAASELLKNEKVI